MIFFVQVDPTHMALVVADTYGQTKDFNTGLKYLSEWLYHHPTIMDKLPSCFDVYEPLLWYDWTYHWNLMKRHTVDTKSEMLMVRQIKLISLFHYLSLVTYLNAEICYLLFMIQ